MNFITDLESKYYFIYNIMTYCIFTSIFTKRIKSSMHRVKIISLSNAFLHFIISFFYQINNINVGYNNIQFSTNYFQQ